LIKGFSSSFCHDIKKIIKKIDPLKNLKVLMIFEFILRNVMIKAIQKILREISVKKKLLFLTNKHWRYKES
jgi:hypothetical protein